MIFKIDEIEIELHNEGKSVSVVTNGQHFILENITLTETQLVIENNYKIVFAYYNASGSKVTTTDLSTISIKIVLLYLELYNSWKNIYPKEKKRSLLFTSEDFHHPTTYNVIIKYFRNKYFKEGYQYNYSKMCEALLRITNKQFIAHLEHYKDEIEKSNWGINLL